MEIAVNLSNGGRLVLTQDGTRAEILFYEDQRDQFAPPGRQFADEQTCDALSQAFRLFAYRLRAAAPATGALGPAPLHDALAATLTHRPFTGLTPARDKALGTDKLPTRIPMDIDAITPPAPMADASGVRSFTLGPVLDAGDPDTPLDELLGPALAEAHRQQRCPYHDDDQICPACTGVPPVNPARAVMSGNVAPPSKLPDPTLTEYAVGHGITEVEHPA